MDVYKKPAGLTPKSLGMYKTKYNTYIKPAIGSMKLKDVREVHLQRILNSQAGMSYSHVSKLRLVMQEVFSRARKSRLISFDPSESLQLPKNEKNSHRSITDEERAAILDLAATHRSGLWILTILYAGLRPGETTALNWEDIDFESNEIHVHKAVESGSETIKTTKTSAGVRDIPMHMELRRRMLEAKGAPDEPVFKMLNGKRQTHDGRRRLWTSFARDLDIKMGARVERNRIIEHAIAPDLTPYCLRHTFCTDLQRAGVPINVAKELMGHSDISVTANIYTHRDQDTLHKNMTKLEESQTSTTASNGSNVAPALSIPLCVATKREADFLYLENSVGDTWSALNTTEDSVGNNVGKYGLNAKTV